MNIFVVGSGGDLDLVVRLAAEGNKVTYWCPVIFQKNEFDDYLKENNVVYLKTPSPPDPPADTDWVICTFIGYGQYVDKLKKKYPVFGTPSQLQKLELDREIGKAIAQKIGFSIPKKFTTTVDDAIQKIKQLKKPFVIKPHNNLPVYMTGIPESFEDSITLLEDIKTRFSGNTKVTCEERIFGAEIGLETFFDGEDYFFPLNLGFEHKRAYTGDMGPLLGEAGTFMYYGESCLFEPMEKLRGLLQMYDFHGDITVGLIVEEETGIPYFLEWTCFDEETEVLTESGWKKGWEVKIGEKVLSINPDTLEIDWKPVTGKFVANYEGPMVNIRSSDGEDFDALVTPDHKLIVIDKQGSLEIKRADQLRHGDKIIRVGKWKGHKPQYIVVDAYTESKKIGRKWVEVFHPAIAVDTLHFCKFLGLFLSSGRLSRTSEGNYGVSISVQKGKKKQVVEILDNLGFKYVEADTGFTIVSFQLGTFLTKLFENFEAIPRSFKDLDVACLEAVLEGFFVGSGHLKNKQRVFKVKSPGLAKDLLEIIHKCGRIGRLVVSEDGEDFCLVIEQTSRKHFNIGKKDYVQNIHYKGKIWDLEVADWHTLFVMRRGSAYFSSNCRMGYPEILIQIQALTISLTELFERILFPKPSKELPVKDIFLNGVGLLNGAVPVESAMRQYGSWFLITGLDEIVDNEVVRNRVNMASINYRDGKFFTSSDEMSLVVIGEGYTGPEAIIDSYKFMTKIKAANSYYRTDIGMRIVRRDIKILYDFGYVDYDHFTRCYDSTFTIWDYIDFYDR